MSLIRWKKKQCEPFQEFLDWEHPFFGLSLFPFAEKSLTTFQENGYPAIDVSEDKNSVTVTADLPGLKKEEIKVSIEQNVLTIRGERKSESEQKDKNFRKVERSYGVFERHLNLGTTVDGSKVKAQYKRGVLEIILPKTEESKSQPIVITGE